MTTQVLLQPAGRILRAAPGDNLLELLRRHEVPISYSCQSGRCGTCRCKVLEGHVMSSGPHAQRPLDGEPGDVLACQSTVAGSCVIELPEDEDIVVHPARILKGTVIALQELTHDIRRVVLKTNKPLEFSPGQYAALRFSPDLARPYSMAGLAGDELEFHVRLVPGGRASGQVAQGLKLGDAIKVSGPMGTAYLRRRHHGPMLCVAGGTGLAPILSILRGCLAAGMGNPVHLYFGVRTARDVYGLEWLQALSRQHPALRVQVVVASGPAGAGQRTGLVTDAIAEDRLDLRGWRAYLCGPPPLVESVALQAERLGARREHIHADAFYSTT